MGIHFDADLALSGFVTLKLALEVRCRRASIQVGNDESHCCGKSVQLEKAFCHAGLFGFRISDQLRYYCYSGVRVFHRWHAAGDWKSAQ
jgi:hypothetical protein